MTTDNLNIITVISHDLGQHMGCYGIPYVRTPNFDEFAENNLRFENNFCTAPQCSPSRAALWTGRYPHANGVIGLTHGGFQNDLNDGESHFAQILDEEGYETHLFGIQHESPDAKRCGYQHIHKGGPCEQVSGDVVDFLRKESKKENRESPFFLQVGFIEPHRPFPRSSDVNPLEQSEIEVLPYLPDIPEVREDLVDLEASISSADKAFGRIVNAVHNSAFADNTIVIFTVDHGIAFPHAKMTLYDPGIETALLMRIPGIEGGRVYDELISNVDLTPTLLDLLNMEIPENIQGRSFKGLIMGNDYQENEAVFAEKTYHTYYDPMRAVRTERWKLIVNFEFAPHQETSPDYDNNAKSYVEIAKAKEPEYMYHPPYELYDLESDPWEQNNLAFDPVYEEIKNKLVKKLCQWMEATGDPLLEGPMAQGVYINRMNEFKEIGTDAN